MAEFEPRIVMFCCNWCSYAGADLAGVARLQYPTTTFILQALKEGADGVLVTGCHIGDCHYVDSNVHTKERMENVVDAMELLGLEGRVHLEWVSASEGPKFRDTVTEFVEQIKALGPSPLRAE
jgi:F420-non-reducing hydrogenase iron-sulfur subunit